MCGAAGRTTIREVSRSRQLSPEAWGLRTPDGSVRTPRCNRGSRVADRAVTSASVAIVCVLHTLRLWDPAHGLTGEYRRGAMLACFLLAYLPRKNMTEISCSISAPRKFGHWWSAEAGHLFSSSTPPHPRGGVGARQPQVECGWAPKRLCRQAPLRMDNASPPHHFQQQHPTPNCASHADRGEVLRHPPGRGGSIPKPHPGVTDVWAEPSQIHELPGGQPDLA